MGDFKKIMNVAKRKYTNSCINIEPDHKSIMQAQSVSAFFFPLPKLIMSSTRGG